MTANRVQNQPDARRWLSVRCGLVLFGLVLIAPASAQEQIDPADRLPPELRERFVPKVKHLPNEALVVRSALLDVLPSQRSRVRRLWSSWGGVVLDIEDPGLTLHFYAEGIKAMTLADKVWEGLPTRAESLQDLMDEVIGRARETGQPIRHLIIAGHAGLPGCSALGGQMEDCTFRGVLSTYQREQLTRLRPYLARGAEIELRQCGTGSGKEGQRLLTAIYQATGAATSSYLADFHFGDADNHPRVRVGADGFEIVKPDK